MATTELTTYDARMLELMDYCMRNHLKGIKTKTDFAEAIGIEHQNLPKVVKGVRGFTPVQQNAAATIFNVSMDWLYGFSEEMFRSKKDKAPDILEALKSIVHTLEKEKAGKPKVSNQKVK